MLKSLLLLTSVCVLGFSCMAGCSGGSDKESEAASKTIVSADEAKKQGITPGKKKGALTPEGGTARGPLTGG
jgi:hypothetical protein